MFFISKNVLTMSFLNDKKMGKNYIRIHVYFKLDKLNPSYLKKTGPK